MYDEPSVTVGPKTLKGYTDLTSEFIRPQNALRNKALLADKILHSVNTYILENKAVQEACKSIAKLLVENPSMMACVYHVDNPTEDFYDGDIALHRNDSFQLDVYGTIVPSLADIKRERKKADGSDKRSNKRQKSL